MGNLHNLIPSLKEKIPTLDSLLPILAECALLQNTKNALTTVTVPQQLQPPPILMPKLQTSKPQPVVPYCATLWNHCLQLHLNTNPDQFHWKC